MKIAVIIGHSKLKNGNYTSASGIKVEYLYCKDQAKELKVILEKEGHQVTLIQCPEGQFTSASQEKAYKLGLINGKGYDLVIELHLNAYNGTAKGTEVLYYPTSSKSKEYAERVVKKLGTQFTNRGVKGRDNLYILKETDCKAILVESFFTDNKDDCAKADKVGVNEIAKLIAEGILNKAIANSKDIYQIVTGGFGTKDKADTFANQLRGITGWYMDVKEVPGYPGQFRIETGGFAGEDKVKAKLNALTELTGWWATYQKI